MGKAFTGGCACGAIHYEIDDEPIAQSDCQCRVCQRKSGTGHGSYLTFPQKSKVTLTGDATHWDIAADSGSNIKTHSFCSTCGSPVYLTLSAWPDLFVIHAGSLDDPGRYQPQAITYRIRGHDWDRVNPALTAFDKMPPM